MFIESVNAAFINDLFMPETIDAMHASMQRLLQFVREATRDTASPINDFAQIGEKLDRSSAVLTNWKSRGISKDGAMQAEAVFGCSARWIMTGEGMAHAALSDEALMRATVWQRLTDQGREVFDRTLELAKLQDLQVAREPAASYKGDASTVPGDLPSSSRVFGADRKEKRPPSKKRPRRGSRKP